MDKNVEILLQTEAEVNKKVNAAIKRKNEQLQSIKKEADIALKEYKRMQEIEYKKKLDEVSPWIRWISFVDVKKISPNFILSVIDKWKNKGWYPSDVILKKGDIFEKGFLNIYLFFY